MAENFEFTPGNAVPALLAAIGLGLFETGLAIPAIAAAESQLTFSKTVAGAAIAILGLSFASAAYFWKSTLGPWIGPRFNRSIESVALDFRYWLGFVCLIFAVSFVVIFLETKGDHATIVSQASEIAKLHADINCYAKPRRLKPEQISKIASYLSAHEPQEVTFNIVSNDNEAGSYGVDMYSALSKGGWKILGINYVGAENFPCHGVSSLKAGLVQVTASCLTLGSGMLCTGQPTSGDTNPVPLNCSQVVAQGDTPAAPGASVCVKGPCFAATGHGDANFTWQQSTYLPGTQEGLQTNFTQTQEHTQAQEDPKHPNTEALLREAFRLANVQIDGGTGGESGVNVKKDSLSITIGHRRRDGYGPGCPQTIMKQETVPAPD
jgi:hypothetical protein